MHNFNLKTQRIAATAVVGFLALAGAVGQASAQAQEKKWKDNAEYEIFNQASKAVDGQNFTKGITDLDTWKQKYPTSDYKDEGTALYIRAYAGAKQPAKVMEVAGPFVSSEMDARLDPRVVVAALFTVIQTLQQLPDANAQQLATAEKAANALLKFNRKPQGVADADWAAALKQLQDAARGTLMTVSVLPASQAAAKKDWATASTLYEKALQQYPENTFIAYNLGTALYQMARADSTKAIEILPRAIYVFARAVAIDPTLGGSQKDPKPIVDFATKAYVTYHGSDEGWEQLKQQAKANPLPPAGFNIKTASEIDAEKENEFKAKYPQLALWLGIKKQLSAPGGAAYFDANLKNADIGQRLKGMVVEGKPACRSTEILVSVPEPEQQNAPVVISLKLEKALTGKPEPGEIEFKGVPSAFSADPFLLTMDIDQADISGLKTSTCRPVAAPPRKSPKKK